MPPPDQRTRQVSRRLISTQYNERGKCQILRPRQLSKPPKSPSHWPRRTGREAVSLADHWGGWARGPQGPLATHWRRLPQHCVCTQGVQSDPDTQGPWVGVALWPWGSQHWLTARWRVDNSRMTTQRRGGVKGRRKRGNRKQTQKREERREGWERESGEEMWRGWSSLEVGREGRVGRDPVGMEG